MSDSISSVIAQLRKLDFFRLDESVLEKYEKFVCPSIKLSNYLYNNALEECKKTNYVTYCIGQNYVLLGYITIGIKIYSFDEKRESTINIARIATNIKSTGCGIGTFLASKAASFAYYHNRLIPMSLLSADAYIKDYQFNGKTLNAKKFFATIGFKEISSFDRDSKFPDEDTQVLVANIEDKNSKIYKFLRECLKQEGVLNL